VLAGQRDLLDAKTKKRRDAIAIEGAHRGIAMQENREQPCRQKQCGA